MEGAIKLNQVISYLPHNNELMTEAKVVGINPDGTLMIVDLSPAVMKMYNAGFVVTMTNKIYPHQYIFEV